MQSTNDYLDPCEGCKGDPTCQLPFCDEEWLAQQEYDPPFCPICGAASGDCDGHEMPAYCPECGADVDGCYGMGEEHWFCRNEKCTWHGGTVLGGHCPECGHSLPIVDADVSGPSYGRCRHCG
jgi:hypothetical protein